MPRQYEAIRDKLVSQGMDLKAAKGHAARIYNAAHPGAPVTGKPEGERPSRRGTMESLRGRAKTSAERTGKGVRASGRRF